MEFQWFQLYVPLVAGAIGFFGNMIFERKKQLKDKATDERRKIYSEFTDIMIDRIRHQQTATIEMNEQFSSRMFEFYKNYLLYASPDVINAVGDFQQFAMKMEALPAEKRDELTYHLKYSKVIYEMREDLGLSIKNLGSHGQHIFKTFFSNYYTIFRSEN